jgi:hypothetical protein
LIFYVFSVKFKIYYYESSKEELNLLHDLERLSNEEFNLLHDLERPSNEEFNLLHDLERPSNEEFNLLHNLERTAEECIEENALVYIAGYVAHRFRNRFNDLGCPTRLLPNLQPNDWLSFISKGNCIYPSSEFLDAANIMEKEFRIFHGDSFSKESHIFDKLINIVCKKTNNKFSKDVIGCLVRTRTYIRLRKINKEITNNNFMKKKKKLYKLCNKK